MAASVGISSDDAVLGAALYQFKTDTARYYYGFPYDDPIDTFFIRAGHKAGAELLKSNQVAPNK